MNTVAFVKEVNGKYAVVETERKSACDGCHKNENGEGCAMCKIFGGSTKISAKAKNAVGAKVGDKVEIDSSSGRMLFYALLVFILPLVFAVAAYFVATEIGYGETVGGVSAICAFVVCFAAVSVISHFVISKRCDVEIVKIID